MKNHGNNHKNPTSPTQIKMDCQERKIASTPIIGYATIPPIAAPELKIPCAKALSFVGNHSAFAFAAPGQFPASAIPKIYLNIEKLIIPCAKAWIIVANDHTPIDIANPIRVPIQSKILPKIV